MRFVHIADTHFSNSLPYGHVDPVSGLSSRFVEQVDTFKGVIDWMVEQDIKVMLHAGDVYNNPNPSDLERTVVEDLWVYAVTAGIEAVVIAGNHDRSDQYTSISDKEELHSVKFITCPTLVCPTGLGGEPVMCVPNLGRGETGQEKALRDASGLPAGILLIHTTFKGATAANGYVMPEGLEIPEGFEYIAAGHIHRGQSFGVGSYCGVPVRLNFGEAGVSTGFVVVDTDDWSRKYVKVPSTEFYTFEDEVDRDKFSDSIVKVVVDEGNVYALREELLALGPKWLSVRKKPGRKVGEAEFESLVETSTLRDNFVAYCEATRVSEEVRDAGLKLLEDE